MPCDDDAVTRGKPGSKDRQGPWILLACLLVLATGVFFGFQYHTVVSTPLAFKEQVLVVERGDTLNSITRKLVSDGQLKYAWPVHLYRRLNDLGGLVMSGEYAFTEEISVSGLIDRLATGQGQIVHKLTIIEGWTFGQMRALVNSAAKLEQVTPGWSDQQLMAELGAPGIHPEGRFYPDTYVYRAGDSDLSIFRTSYRLMQERLDAAWDGRQPDIVLTDPYEALIMASIIEKESQARDELRDISGVFHNRLRLGMRMQADPTVIYGMGESFNGNLSKSHLRADSPYNTYTRSGLPPTPISLPGQAALAAAVNPSDTRAVYFVASGDGRHVFSRTLEEHNRAVRKYIRRQKGR